MRVVLGVSSSNSFVCLGAWYFLAFVMHIHTKYVRTESNRLNKYNHWWWSSPRTWYFDTFCIDVDIIFQNIFLQPNIYNLFSIHELGESIHIERNSPGKLVISIIQTNWMLVEIHHLPAYRRVVLVQKVFGMLQNDVRLAYLVGCRCEVGAVHNAAHANVAAACELRDGRLWWWWLVFFRFFCVCMLLRVTFEWE